MNTLRPYIFCNPWLLISYEFLSVAELAWVSLILPAQGDSMSVTAKNTLLLFVFDILFLDLTQA